MIYSQPVCTGQLTSRSLSRLSGLSSQKCKKRTIFYLSKNQKYCKTNLSQLYARRVVVGSRIYLFSIEVGDMGGWVSQVGLGVGGEFGWVGRSCRWVAQAAWLWDFRAA